jgi:hypothetical protein
MVGFDAIDRKFRRREIKLECVDCQSTDSVRMQDPYTAHPFDGEPGSLDDPNRPLPLCCPCIQRRMVEIIVSGPTFWGGHGA